MDKLMEEYGLFVVEGLAFLMISALILDENGTLAQAGECFFDMFLGGFC